MEVRPANKISSKLLWRLINPQKDKYKQQEMNEKICIDLEPQSIQISEWFATLCKRKAQSFRINLSLDRVSKPKQFQITDPLLLKVQDDFGKNHKWKIFKMAKKSLISFSTKNSLRAKKVKMKMCFPHSNRYIHLCRCDLKILIKKMKNLYWIWIKEDQWETKTLKK